MASTEVWAIGDDGTRLYACTVGTGPTPVIIPTACFLSAELPALAEGRMLIFYDTRSRGQSDAITDPAGLTMAHEVRDLEAVRRHFGLDQFCLLGWSYLGAVAALYASAYSQAVMRLLLVGPMHPRRHRYSDEDPARFEARVDPAGRQRLAAMRQAGLETREPAAFCRAYYQVTMPRQMGRPGALSRMRSDPCVYENEWAANITRTWQYLAQARGAWDWRPEIARVQAATLVMQGAEDSQPLAAAREWAATLPNARLLVLPEVGHYPWLEDPHAFFSAAEQFLSGAWPPGATVVHAVAPGDDGQR